MYEQYNQHHQHDNLIVTHHYSTLEVATNDARKLKLIRPYLTVWSSQSCNNVIINVIIVFASLFMHNNLYSK